MMAADASAGPLDAAHLCLCAGLPSDGILMSDWDATYDGVAAALGGLDLEMPFAKFMNSAALMPALSGGAIEESLIDDKVKRILRVIFRFGFYDRIQKDSSIQLDDAANAKVALDVARGGIVLLKNDKNILPLSSNIKSIALFGPNVNNNPAGGGSSYTVPYHYVSLLKGIEMMYPGVKINYVNDRFTSLEDRAANAVFFTAKGDRTPGVIATYFNNKELQGEPVATQTEKVINNIWSGKPGVAGLGAENYSIRYTGIIRPEQTGNYKISVKGDDGFRLFINGENVIEEWHDQAPKLKFTIMQLEAGKEYPFKLEYYQNGGGAQISMAYFIEKIAFTDAEKAAAAADIAIVTAGFDNSSEGEGADRSFELPEYQDTFINAIAKANPNTIVVLNAGGNVAMTKWLPNVKA
ncbi:MAG: hypothetical protein EOO88_52300, partial [Pedobacter sp.]